MQYCTDLLSKTPPAIYITHQKCPNSKRQGKDARKSAYRCCNFGECLLFTWGVRKWEGPSNFSVQGCTQFDFLTRAPRKFSSLKACFFYTELTFSQLIVVCTSGAVCKFLWVCEPVGQVFLSPSHEIMNTPIISMIEHMIPQLWRTHVNQDMTWIRKFAIITSILLPLILIFRDSIYR